SRCGDHFARYRTAGSRAMVARGRARMGPQRSSPTPRHFRRSRWRPHPRGLSDARGVEVIKRTATLMKWQARPSPGPDKDAPIARGRGMAYVHYKHDETYVAIGMEVAVDRSSGKITVERVACAHDCGQIINPDGVRAQVEGW